MSKTKTAAREYAKNHHAITAAQELLSFLTSNQQFLGFTDVWATLETMINELKDIQEEIEAEYFYKGE